MSTSLQSQLESQPISAAACIMLPLVLQCCQSLNDALSQHFSLVLPPVQFPKQSWYSIRLHPGPSYFALLSLGAVLSNRPFCNNENVLRLHHPIRQPTTTYSYCVLEIWPVWLRTYILNLILIPTRGQWQLYWIVQLQEITFISSYGFKYFLFV